MATNTAHYNLVKPAGSESYDVSVQNQNMEIIDDALWGQRSSILANTNDSYQRVYLEKYGSIYHLHYERYIPVANGTQVTSISVDYAPSAVTYGQNFFQQTSGYGLCRCTVATTGAISLSAVTYDDPVAGVFDVYWTK